MKKIFFAFAIILLGIFFMTSCKSRGPKCPGMYSQVNDKEIHMNQ